MKDEQPQPKNGFEEVAGTQTNKLWRVVETDRGMTIEPYTRPVILFMKVFFSIFYLVWIGIHVYAAYLSESAKVF